MEDRPISIMLAGMKGVGKSVYIERHSTGEFIKEYKPTCHDQTNTLCFRSQYEYPAQQDDLQEVIHSVDNSCRYHTMTVTQNHTLSNLDGIIVMFDVTNEESFFQSMGMIECFHYTYPKVPIVWTGNKVDIRERQVQWKRIKRMLDTRMDGKVLKYFDVSAKSNFNFDKPFVELLRKITGKSDLTLVNNEAIVPPTVDFLVEEMKEEHARLMAEIDLDVDDLLMDDEEYEEEEEEDFITEFEKENSESVSKNDENLGLVTEFEKERVEHVSKKEAQDPSVVYSDATDTFIDLANEDDHCEVVNFSGEVVEHGLDDELIVPIPEDEIITPRHLKSAFTEKEIERCYDVEVLKWERMMRTTMTPLHAKL